MLNAYYWKDELRELVDEIDRYANLSEDENRDAPDVPYSAFRLERALFYSAFTIRLLYESEKLTSSMKGYTLAVEEIENTIENPERIPPLFRRYPDSKYYDFSNSKKRAISGRYLVNQLIHSFVIISFETDCSGAAIGFYVTSDHDANKKLYYCSLGEWLKYINAVVEDEITCTHSHYDESKGRWVVVKS